MNEQKILDFKEQLEAIATYGNETIAEIEFKSFFKELKDFAFTHEINLPEIFKYTGNMLDFRRKMQQYGGYADRRRVLDEAIYSLCDSIERINIKENKETIIDNRYIDRRTIISKLKDTKNINTKYGKITFDSLDIKEGGNSIVIFGLFQNEKVAVKVLVNNNARKTNRFLCEFANVIIKLNEVDSVAKLYFYDTVKIGDNVLDIIVMKYYPRTLEYDSNFSVEEIIRIFKQLIDCIESVHNKGIIHRDLKPQNILLNENLDIVVADFGIAYYNPEIFEMTGNTTSGERLANFDFSAPEQRDSKIEPYPTMDIYAIGQIVQWLVYGNTHKGTNRKRLTEKYDDSRMKLLDSIVERCLDNDPKNRYQSISEIKQEISKYNEKARKAGDIKCELNKQFDVDDLKERLIDILDSICGTDNNNKKFEIYSSLTRKETVYFLDNLESRLNKLRFFDSIGLSKVINSEVNDLQTIDKKYFEELNNMYILVKNNASDLLDSFIEYVRLSLNSNIFELPF